MKLQTMIIQRKAARLPLFCLFFGVSISMSHCAEAQPSSADVTVQESLVPQIGEAASRSAEELDPERIRDIEPAREEFLRAVEALRQYLSETTDAENADAWLKYLEIEPVLEGIEADESSGKLARQAIQVVQKTTGLHPGLEIASVRNVRQAADDFSNALRFSKKEQITQAIAKLLQRFSDKWNGVDANPAPEELDTLMQLLDFLDRTEQEVLLVDQAKQAFSKPNIHVMVDDSLVQRSINRNVLKCSPVRDCILGTRIVGNALLNGNVTASLLPSIGTVRVQLALSGNINSNNIGYNGPIRLRTSSSSQIHVSRLLTASESGIRLDPVSASASLQSQINAIEHPLGLVRRIARKRAGKQKPQADAIAKRRLIDRVSKQFAEDTDKAADQPMVDLFGKATTYLQRLNLEEPQRSFGSTSESVYLAATVWRDNQLAAPVSPPPAPSGYELTVQLHESLINNTIGASLAGRTMTRSQLARLVKRTGRSESKEGASSTDQDDTKSEEMRDFEIDFHTVRPIVMKARDGVIKIGVRGTRFKRGNREEKSELEISATYRPVTNDDGTVILKRESDVGIYFIGSKRLTIRQSGIRVAIQESFANAFPETLMDRPWTVPETVEAESVAGRTYRPHYFDAQGGWVTLSVR